MWNRSASRVEVIRPADLAGYSARSASTGVMRVPPGRHPRRERGDQDQDHRRDGERGRIERTGLEQQDNRLKLRQREKSRRESSR